MKRHPSAFCHSPPSRSRRWLAPLAITAAFAACLEPDKPGDCDDGADCLLVEDSASSSGSDAKPASAFIPPPPGGLVNTAVNSGWTEGSFSVGHGGAAEYALPLWVPDGRRGHQPSLSLHYSSQGGNGLVGVGWSLSGLSSIAPCPRTLAQDGERRKVQHTAADVYCLDGQRLRPTGPMNWPEDLDMEYRTEEDSFARIIAQWAPNPDPFGSPQPSYFKVWTKDGRILTFGGDASSRVSASRFHGIDPDDPSFTPSGGRAIAAWRLSQVDDRNGNSIAIEYEKVEAQGTMWSLEMVPRRITYGPDRQVDFVYEGRPDPIDSFQPGASAAIHIRLARRLKTIQMRAGTELLREYRLVYASNSITARSLLKSITECDRNGVCLLPLQFDWALGSYAFGVIDTNVTDVGVSTASKNRFIAADINGDGRDDLVYGDAQNQWKMRFSDGAGGFTDGDLTGIPRAQEATYAPRIHPIDYNRDSRLDLLVEVPHPQSGTKFALYRSNGSGFQAAADIDSLALGGPGSGGVHEAYFLDLDGNGFTDYVAPQNSTVGLLRWRYRLNLGASFAPIQVTSLFSNFNGTYVRATDFDGDGRSNLLIGAFDHQAALQYEGALSVSSSYINLPFNHPPETVDHKNLHLADVNGDGLEDAVYPFSGLAVQLNSGRGFSEILPGASEYVSPADPSNGTYDRNVRIVDFNNDGSDDVLVFHPGTPSGPTDYDSGFQLYVWRANQFVRIPLNRAAPLSEPLRQATQALDFNGDGAVDLAQVWTSSTPFLRLLRREGGIPDRLVRVNVGTLGPRVEVDYSNLADPAVHAPGVCILPLICPRRGGTLVRMHRLANGVDTGSPWRSFLHSYTAARMDPNGRGWLGFKTHQVLDTERGATTTVTFNNEARLNFAAAGAQAYAYPLVNRPIKIEYELEVQPPLDVQYRRVVNKRYDFAPAAVDGTYVVEPLTWRSESDRERRDGGDWVDLHSRSATLLYDDFGSVSQVTTVMPGSDRVDVLTHLNDEDSWIIGRLETKTTTSCTRPENVCQTRESALEYEDNGDLKAVTVEPNDDDFRLRTDFDYGTFGNITSITSANAEGESRAITVAYDSLDLYPTTTTNALGHISQVTVHSGLGVPLGHVDPNGVPSTMKHDWFGRPREAHFADGYFERYDTNGPLIHTTTVPAGPGTTIAGEVIVMDALGRVREHRVPAFGGGQSTVRASYDRLGRTEAISRPFITAENLHWTTYDYDYLDRLIASEAPDGQALSHEYIALETHTVDPKGVESYVVERGDGRIASRFEHDPDSTGLETRFEYGPFGLVRRIEAADGTSQSMTYDRRGRRIEHVDPSAGTTSSTYNAFGELTDGIDGAGRPVQIQYDVLGRPTRITSPDGTATNTWDVSPFGKGRLYEGKSADGVVTRHHYDDSGHHVRSTWNVEGAQYVVDFSHEIGRLASITYPALPGVTGRHKVDYIYKPNGYLWQAKDAATGALYWRADGRNAAGQLEEEFFGNNVVGSREYDPETGLLSAIGTDGPGGQLDRLTYGYDLNRNVTLRSDLVGSDARTQSYAYDSLDRLSTWTFSRTPADAVTTTFVYDDLGNLQSETAVGRAGRNATYLYGQDGAPPHVLTSRNGARYTYDGAGRQITGPNRTIVYNRLGLPTRITRTGGQTTDFKYDADGTRVLKRDPTETTISIAGLFERRLTTEARNVHYILADGRAVAQVTKVQGAPTGPVTSTETRYIHPDGQGSTIQVTASNGTVAEEFFYDPFGRRTNSNYDYLGAQRRAIRLGFTSHEHDDELGLINMQGRIYDPEARRFLTPDPIVQSPLSSQSYNRYAYVWNNPATFIDPTGFCRGVEDDPECHNETVWTHVWGQFRGGTKLPPDGRYPQPGKKPPGDGNGGEPLGDGDDPGSSHDGENTDPDPPGQGPSGSEGGGNGPNWVEVDAERPPLPTSSELDGDIEQSFVPYLFGRSDCSPQPLCAELKAEVLLSTALSLRALTEHAAQSFAGGLGGAGSRGFVRGMRPTRVIGNARNLIIDAAQATDDELRAALAVSRMGRGPVVLRDPVPGRTTSDLLVNGAPYDIYTPKTANADRIIGAMSKKNSQASGIILDLSRSSVSLESLGNVLARIRGAGGTNIRDVIILGR